MRPTGNLPAYDAVAGRRFRTQASRPEATEEPMTQTTIQGGHGDLPVYLAAPPGPPPWHLR